jgi:hypothetical protein
LDNVISAVELCVFKLIKVWHVLYFWLQHYQISNQSRFSWGLEVIEQIYCAVRCNLMFHNNNVNLYFTDQTKTSKGPSLKHSTYILYTCIKGGGYGFKLFTLELKIIDALQQIFFSSKFIIILVWSVKYRFTLLLCNNKFHLTAQYICSITSKPQLNLDWFEIWLCWILLQISMKINNFILVLYMYNKIFHLSQFHYMYICTQNSQ